MQVAIGERLRILRIEKGYPDRKDFVARHDLPPLLYKQVENGTANLTLKFLHKILTIHNITMGEFFNEA